MCTTIKKWKTKIKRTIIVIEKMSLRHTPTLPHIQEMPDKLLKHPPMATPTPTSTLIPNHLWQHE